ncbi:helix-turn-helix transcriptional regulator [Trinickia sp.]|uniref:helix-turn-helix transcriptional regulator n=1 Tax=Trinickia sp. TaxID=2571163 RepID=UPI003F804FDE
MMLATLDSIQRLDGENATDDPMDEAASRLRHAVVLSDWFDALMSVGRSHGFDDTTFVLLPGGGFHCDDAFVRSNCAPSIGRLYRNAKSAATCPLLSYALAHASPILWSEAWYAKPPERALYERLHGNRRRWGVLLPLHGPRGRTGMLCFASGADTVTLERQASAQLARLGWIRDVAMETARPHVERHFSSVLPKFTPRESEIMKWWVLGKTACEIAIILDCSQSAINFHLANIRMKLGVNTSRAAAVKAIELGLLK